MPAMPCLAPPLVIFKNLKTRLRYIRIQRQHIYDWKTRITEILATS